VKNGAAGPGDQPDSPGRLTMKITADLEKCEGLGMCEAMADDYFEVDDDTDQVVIHNDSPPEDARAHVNAAVQACPVLALTLSD